MINRNKKQSGFTLLEALLTTAVLSGVLIIIFDILQDYSDQILMKSASNYMETLALSIEKIIENPEYFELVYIEADAQVNNIIDSITPADILAGTIGTLTLPNTSVLNASFKETTPLKTGVSIMIRASGVNALEVIIATNGLVQDKRVRTAAEFSKLNGGFYRDAADGIKHAYNAWNFPVATLSGTNWHALATAGAGIPSPANGSYLINYRHISFDEIAGDYLYRTRVIGKPELNTLYGNLNMGGQNILGADNIDVNGNIQMESKAVVNGSVNVVGNANFIGGNFRASNSLSTGEATINSTVGGTTGNFIVQNQLSSNSINLNTVNAGNATFNGGITTSGSLSATNVDTVSSIQTTNVNATNLNTAGLGDINIDLSSGDLKTQAITTQSLTVNGTQPIGANDVIVDTANFNNINTNYFIVNDLNVNTFGACESGC